MWICFKISIAPFCFHASPIKNGPMKIAFNIRMAINSSVQGVTAIYVSLMLYDYPMVVNRQRFDHSVAKLPRHSVAVRHLPALGMVDLASLGEAAGWSAPVEQLGTIHLPVDLPEGRFRAVG